MPSRPTHADATENMFGSPGAIIAANEEDEFLCDARLNVELGSRIRWGARQYIVTGTCHRYEDGFRHVNAREVIIGCDGTALEIGAIRAESYNNVAEIVDLLSSLRAARTADERNSIWLRCQQIEDAVNERGDRSAHPQPYERREPPQTSAVLDLTGYHEAASELFAPFQAAVMRQLLRDGDIDPAGWSFEWNDRDTVRHEPRALTAPERRFMLRHCGRMEAELRWLIENNPEVGEAWKEAERLKLSETTAAEIALIALARQNEDLRREVALLKKPKPDLVSVLEED